ncbi:MAG: hypothetical protein KC731_38525, partial [Myxococcales bacterium]|nr:hypothetical protein [Myxococcales bacterium]
SCADLPAPSSAPAIEPGTMTTSGDFTILTEGGVVAMQYGSQGGTHIDISAHTFVDPGIALNVGIEVIGDYTGTTETSHAACPSGQWGEVTGRVFDPPWGEAMLRLTLRDGGTDIASTELTILVQE